MIGTMMSWTVSHVMDGHNSATSCRTSKIVRRSGVGETMSMSINMLGITSGWIHLMMMMGRNT